MPHAPSHQPRRKRWPMTLAGMLLLLLLFGVSQYKSKNEPKIGKGQQQAVSVVVTPVRAQTMPVEIKTIGNVESISSVIVKAQTEGRITGVFFKEGDVVQQGKLLFTIDPQPIQASIAQAQATVSREMALVSQAKAQLVKDQAQVRQTQAALKRDQAQLKYAKAQEQRYAKLLSEQYISQSEYEQALANRRAAEETVLADQAALENSQALLAADQATIESAEANVRAAQALVDSYRIQLAYCYIRAPLSGRTGSLKARIGDTIKSNDTPLVVINQLNPVYVGFSIPEQTMETIRATAGRSLDVTVKTRENPPLALKGKLDFVENTVDTATGTIRLKALLENKNHLWPGQFVDVALNLGEQPNALVIPSKAIQNGQTGDYVFVAESGKAQLRSVTVSRIVNDWAVIQTGLKLGEKVISDGQFQLSPDSPIQEASIQPTGSP